MGEDEKVGWHHRLSGHEFEQTLGDSEGQGSLICCRPWGHKELDTAEQLNNNNTYQKGKDKRSASPFIPHLLVKCEKKSLHLHKSLFWDKIPDCILQDGVSNKWVLLVLFFW